MRTQQRHRVGRRGLLAAAAVAALAPALRGRGSTEAAGNPILLGEVNVAGRETVLSSVAPEASTFRVVAAERIALLGQQGDAFDVGAPNAGVCGASSNGIGVCAVGLDGGRALEVRGRSAFAGAGSEVIPQGMASYTIEGVRIPEGALILAELQGYGGPAVGVRYVRRIDETRFRVTLTAITSRACTLGYFIFERA